jgi:hypothetical protein
LKTVAELLNWIYHEMLLTHVRALTYNKMWVLRDAATGELLTHLVSAQKEFDSRSLAEAGIGPGALLETVPLK